LKRLILASTSPRRKELLKEAGYEFEVMEPVLGEIQLHRQPPEIMVEAEAYAKARQVVDKAGDAVIIAADTLVSLADQVIGKPKDENEAREILKKLSGTTHWVISGICFIDAATGDRLIAYDRTKVTMAKMSDAEIDEYVASGQGLDKAGGYAVQQGSDKFIKEIEGSFSNAVGLPLELLERMLKALERRSS
jgi:septum formation protein